MLLDVFLPLHDEKTFFFWTFVTAKSSSSLEMGFTATRGQCFGEVGEALAAVHVRGSARDVVVFRSDPGGQRERTVRNVPRGM